MPKPKKSQQSPLTSPVVASPLHVEHEQQMPSDSKVAKQKKKEKRLATFEDYLMRLMIFSWVVVGAWFLWCALSARERRTRN